MSTASGSDARQNTCGFLTPLLRSLRAHELLGALANAVHTAPRAVPTKARQANVRLRLHVRTLWISDVHLGTRDCKADYLLDLLAHTECKQIYLVGDIIDFWRLQSSWYWPA